MNAARQRAYDASNEAWMRNFQGAGRLRRSSIGGHRTAPARKEIGLLTLGEQQCGFDRVIEVVLDELALDPSPEKIRPKEFAERRRVLREPACPAQFAGERTER